MNEAKEYRCRQTGKVFSKEGIPDQVNITRYLPPKVKQHGKWVQPKLYFIYPPKNERDYDQFLFDMADIDPVFGMATPKINGYHQRIVKKDPVFEDGRWRQNLVVEEIYTDLPSQVTAAKRRAKEMSQQKRDAGIMVGDIPVRTDTAGLARLTAAVLAKSENIDYVVGDKTWKLNAAQMSDLLDKANAHVQSTYTERVKAQKKIEKSKKPFDVDVSALHE